MALSFLPQPRIVKTLGGFLDFRETDVIYYARKDGGSSKAAAEYLSEELGRQLRIEYKLKPSSKIKTPNGLIITHHTREGIYVPTKLTEPEGYELLVAGHSLMLSAVDADGLFRALQTIRDLLQDGGRVPTLTIQDWPLVRLRALHLDLKGFTPNAQGLREFIDFAARAKFNTILVEYEDRFPYQCAPELRGCGGFSKEDLQTFLHNAARVGLRVVPLIQTLGHLEFLLKHDAYAALREVRGAPQQVCPSSAKARKLLEKMVKEVIAAHPEAPAIHLGGDEAYQLGRCSTCRKAAGAGEFGKQKLYLKHMGRFVRLVRAAKKDVWLWDDMLRCELPPELRRKLPKGVTLVYWDYRPRGGQYSRAHLPHLEYYATSGWKVLGASAAGGADGWNGDIPRYRDRMANADWWAEAAEIGAPLSGHVATSWTRYSSLNTPCDPPALVWPSVFYSGERLWLGLGSSRESFERRLMGSFYGLRSEQAEVAAALYGAGGDRPAVARETLARLKRGARRNRDLLELTEAAAGLRELIRRRKELTEVIGVMLPGLEKGCADPVAVRRIREQLESIAAEAGKVRKELAKQLNKRCCREEVEAYLNDRFLVFERLGGAARRLLK